MRDDQARAAIRQLLWAVEDLLSISQVMRWDAVVGQADMPVVDHVLARVQTALREAAALTSEQAEVPA